ncbi:hypothetical protein D3C71_1342910 [compost metagenome]
MLQVDLSLDVVSDTFQVIQFGNGDQGRAADLAVNIGNSNHGRCQVSSHDGRSGTGDGVLLRVASGVDGRFHLLLGDSFQGLDCISSKDQWASQSTAVFRQVVFQATASGNCQHFGTVVPAQCLVGGVDPRQTLNKINAGWVSGETLRLEALDLTNYLNIAIIAHVNAPGSGCDFNDFDAGVFLNISQ